MLIANNAAVLAEVLETELGLVQESSSGSGPIQFTDVYLKVKEDLSRRSVGLDVISISIRGGGTTPFFTSQPPYYAGEQYVLFLVRGKCWKPPPNVRCAKPSGPG